MISQTCPFLNPGAASTSQSHAPHRIRLGARGADLLDLLIEATTLATYWLSHDYCTCLIKTAQSCGEAELDLTRTLAGV
jgi:hypothetical protein